MSDGIDAEFVKRFLLNGCGYHADLVREHYEFAQDGKVDLAAFAHRPFDARSACLAVIESRNRDPRRDVLSIRALGAPVVFVCAHNRLQVWKPGPTGAECLEQGLTRRQVPGYFSKNHANLSPRRIYDAKTLGRLPGSDRQLELFVDPGLLPYAEQEVGGVLTRHVVESVRTLADSFSEQLTDAQQDWIFKSAFRLLAAKILQDKRVPGFIRLNLTDVGQVLRRVHDHYGTTDPVRLGRPPQRKALETAAEEVRSLGNLRNLTTEALADVYEQALITAETRRLHGTHGTPSYLVDYIVWELASWIEQIDPNDLAVFEPGCGHAPFLVGAMRLLRNFDLGLEPPQLSSFFRKRLFGIDTDRFALEIARLSLTVADEPNRNGWDGLVPGNMFQKHALEDAARRCTVLLANPPYERGKALTMLRRTLPELPDGAVFGVVVPATILFSEKKDTVGLRQWLAEHCQLKTVCLFPDQVFRFSDQECTVILGRKVARFRSPPARTRLRRIREQDRDAFRMDYQVSTDRVCPQSAFAARPGTQLWIPDFFDEIWRWLQEYRGLQSIAAVGQGLQHKSKQSLPSGAKTIQRARFAGSVAGFASSHGDWPIHEQPRMDFFNLSEEVISRRRSGVDTGIPQVVVNYNPVGRDIWRLKPFVDAKGRAVSSNFITVRPTSDDWALEYLWAICCSPLANAYVYTHCLKRHIHAGDLRKLPVPTVCRSEASRVVRAARDYLEAARLGPPSLFSAGSSEADLYRRLRRLDAEVLRLYDLPARAERKLLDQFTGKQRPGVAMSFTRYYREDVHEKVPLYAYLSDSFQRKLNGQDPALPSSLESRYLELMERRDSGEITSEDRDELRDLQAEVDGFEYTTQTPDDSWVEEAEKQQRQADIAIGSLTDHAIDLVHRAGSHDED